MLGKDKNAKQNRRGTDPFRQAARRDTEAGESHNWKRVFMSGLFSLPITVAIGAVLLLVTAVIAYSNSDPEALLAPLALSALVLTAVLGGFVASRRCGHSPIVCGSIGGVLFAFLLFVISLGFSDETRSTLTLGLTGGVNFFVHVGVVVLEIIGAVLGNVIRISRENKTRHHAVKR